MIDLAEQPSVTLQVVRSEAGFNPLLEGPFILFEFAKGKPIVHLEHHRAALFLQNERDVADFGAAAAAIREMALEPDESVEFIADVMHDWRDK
ncbi:hypothetical protein LX83_006003 [Goodfellowiella coeruleoviolacea]|uniref:DUF5753 domain-containing protein n=2 Tax=Goodfellowiella coeruleoviolacea TaxID=334858 RepID=A0AAE3GKV3_9PSEU|nr:hypothetical protein [Goodfellowiella coeruleoviolacea]